MKKIVRLGVFLSAIGVTLVVVTFLRGMSPIQRSYAISLPPQSWKISKDEFWLPRSLRIEVAAESAVDMYILNENGVIMWQQEERLSPLYTFNQTEIATYTVNIDRRGIYSFLFYNPSDSVVDVEMNITVYGLEQDLLWVSIIMTALGAIIVIAQRFLFRVLPANRP
jgi:hypothetical protein